MNFLFAGMKHCGKSTHGRFLAEHFSCPFYDTDDFILLDYFERTGLQISIRDFFKLSGKDEFQRAEADAFRGLLDKLAENSASDCLPEHNVISLGGQLPCNPLLQDLLPDCGVFVFLRIDPLILYERVAAGGHFPFLREDNPREDFLRLYESRRPYYEQNANLIIDLDDRPEEAAARLVTEKIEEFIHGR